MDTSATDIDPTRDSLEASFEAAVSGLRHGGVTVTTRDYLEARVSGQVEAVNGLPSGYPRECAREQFLAEMSNTCVRDARWMGDRSIEEDCPVTWHLTPDGYVAVLHERTGYAVSAPVSFDEVIADKLRHGRHPDADRAVSHVCLDSVMAANAVTCGLGSLTDVSVVMAA